jgi:hypothetical protein
MWVLGTWVLGEPLNIVLDVPDCLYQQPLSLFIFYIGIDDANWSRYWMGYCPLTWLADLLLLACSTRICRILSLLSE